jgi:hypothetical protein
MLLCYIRKIGFKARILQVLKPIYKNKKNKIIYSI